MQAQSPPPKSGLEQATVFGSWLGFLCQVLEASLAIFLRRNFGARFLGLRAFLVIPLVLLYASTWEGYDLELVYWYLGLYVLGCGIAQKHSRRNQQKGIMTHSLYSGTPVMLTWRLFRGKLEELHAKKALEPLLVVSIGAIISEFDEPLGSYLILAAIGQAISVNLSVMHEKRQLTNARDALLEQQLRSERLRGREW